MRCRPVVAVLLVGLCSCRGTDDRRELVRARDIEVDGLAEKRKLAVFDLSGVASNGPQAYQDQLRK